jgi:hypothetical protein
MLVSRPGDNALSSFPVCVSFFMPFHDSNRSTHVLQPYTFEAP